MDELLKREIIIGATKVQADYKTTYETAFKI